VTAADCKSVALWHTWFDSKILHQFYWLVRIMVITSDCLSDHGSSILPRVASLLREGQVDPNGLISHIEGGALPPPATKFCPIRILVLYLSCNQVKVVQFYHGAPNKRAFNFLAEVAVGQHSR
jgi:hypothetical protein